LPAHTEPTSAPRPAATPRRVGAACLLSAVCFIFYLTNLRPIGAWDSIPARLLPFSILRQGSSTLHIGLTNRSDVTWPAFSDFGYLQVWILYRWWSGGAVMQGEGGFIPLARNLGPQESIALNAEIEPPYRRGDYQLELLVTQAIDPTKGRSGGAALRVPVRVE
jgi:hypothetical protein